MPFGNFKNLKQVKIISGCRDGIVRIWCLETGECVREMQAHQGGVNSLQVRGWVCRGVVWNMAFIIELRDLHRYASPNHVCSTCCAVSVCNAFFSWGREGGGGLWEWVQCACLSGKKSYTLRIRYTTKRRAFLAVTCIQLFTLKKEAMELPFSTYSSCP